MISAIKYIFYYCQVLQVSGSYRAVLVAGSQGFSNYRHQADLCHAYHLIASQMTDPSGTVIAMSYDDAAFAAANKFQGCLFNEPDGVDVRSKCLLTFSGENVSVDNFKRSVLERDVLGGINLVLIAFMGHGDRDVLYFPNEELTGSEFIDLLWEAHVPNARTLILIDSCESASLFEGASLPPGVIAITASSDDESSFGVYCPSGRSAGSSVTGDLVRGEYMGVCLGDLFTVAWLAEAEKFEGSLGGFIERVTLMVSRRSRVTWFGDVNLLDMRASAFFGKFHNGEL